MKLRLTALSISSMDMNTVMMLRRNRNPATPIANKIALRIRYQAMGVLGGSWGILVDLPSRQDDRPQDGNQDQDAGDFKREQVCGEKSSPDIERGALAKRSEDDSLACRQHALDDI